MRTLAVLVATAAMACASTSRESRSSAAGLNPEQVRLAQRTLAIQGYAAPLSGRVDDQTHTAIVQFQRASHLSESGELDAETLRKLDVDPSDVNPVRGESVSPDLDNDGPWKGGE